MAIQVAGDWPRPRVSVVIPTLNEAHNLPHVLTKLPASIHEVIVVDGHSQDNTVEVARELRPDAHIVMQTGRGKGNALACGFAAASGEVIVTIDADGSNDPAEIPLFVNALVEGADFVKGTRYAKGGGSTDITRVRSLGNHFIRHLVNLCYRTKYSDLCYGYTALWRRCVPALRLNITSAGSRRCRGDGFEVETLISIRAAAAGLAVAEVPSFEHARIYGLSNLHPIRDGWRILILLLTELREWRLAQWRSARATLASTVPGSGSAAGDAEAPGVAVLPQPPAVTLASTQRDWQVVLPAPGLDMAKSSHAGGRPQAGPAPAEEPSGNV